MRTPRLFLGIFALALRLPLLLLACDGSGELTGGRSSGRAPAGADLARNGPGSAGRPL